MRDFSIIHSLLQDMRDKETFESLDHAHICGLLTASSGFDALERIESALVSIKSMTDQLADSRYAKAANGETLGAEINRIAIEALKN
jgi:hypothetical protein